MARKYWIWGVLPFCLFFATFGATARAERPELWESVLQAVSQTRQVLEAAPAEAQGRTFDQRVQRLGRRIASLVEDPEGLEAFQQYLYNEGALESDTLLHDLDAIARLTPPDGDARRRGLLNQLGFPELARRLRDPSIDEEVGGLEAIGGPRMASMRSFSLESLEMPMAMDAPSESASDRRRREAEERLARIDDAMRRITTDQQAFSEAARSVQRNVFRLHTVLIGIAAISAVVVTGRYFDLTRLSPREVVGIIAGTWAANYVTHWIGWIWSGGLRGLQEWRTVQTRESLNRSWSELLDLAPEFAQPNLTAAARPKPTSLETQVGLTEDQALEVYLSRTTDPAATHELMRIGLASLETGQSSRARRVFTEVERRGPQSELGLQARAAINAIGVKDGIEWKVTKTKVWSAAKKTGLWLLALVGLDQVVANTVTQEVSRWRGLLMAGMFGLVNPRTVWSYLWRNPGRATLNRAIGNDAEALADAFRELMTVDPSGEIVARMAMFNTSLGAQPIIFDAALTALESVTGGAVTRTVFDMLRHEISNTQGSSVRVTQLMETAFRQYRSCLAHIASSVTGGAAAQ